MTNTQQPIGIFDSGIGGLTVANAIIRHLPNEEIIYFGDTAHLPYGEKSADAIRYFSLRIVKFLLEQNCKMIVVACNSASSAAYHVLLNFFENQALFVNVVDPLVEEVVSNNFAKTGIIGTKATIHSRIYEKQLKTLQPDIRVNSLSTPLLAPMIEEGYLHDKISKSIIDNYLSWEGFSDIDALLLACTHYPLIRNDIEDFFKNKVEIFDSTDIIAKSVKKRLEKNKLLNDKKRKSHKFYVSDYTESFDKTTKIFFGEQIHLEHHLIW